MGIVEWAKSPWGQDVPIHIFWYLIWVSAFAGLAFLVAVSYTHLTLPTILRV